MVKCYTIAGIKAQKWALITFDFQFLTGGNYEQKENNRIVFGGCCRHACIHSDAVFAEGIALSANVSSYAEYALLSSDATFESVAAVYGAEAQA